MKAKRGEYWYVKLKSGQTVFPVLVEDASKETILLKEFNDIETYADGSRYRIADVQFVEKITRQTMMEKP